MAIDRPGNQNSVSRFSISPDVAERFGFRLPGETDFRQARRKTSSVSRRHRSRARSRWLMTVPLIYRCHFSRIDGIRWYSLCARRTHIERRVVHFPETTGAAKTRQLRYYTMRRGRKSERDTRKGEWKSAVTDTRFGDPQKIRKLVLADVPMLSAPWLITFHRASLNAAAEDLRSTLRWSWIRSCPPRGNT